MHAAVRIRARASPGRRPSARSRPRPRAAARARRRRRGCGRSRIDAAAVPGPDSRAAARRRARARAVRVRRDSAAPTADRPRSARSWPTAAAGWPRPTGSPTRSRRRRPRRRASISRVISANHRSESVSPCTCAIPSGPSSDSSAGSPSITPLWANSRPSCSNGCVLATVSAPVEAKPDVGDERPRLNVLGLFGEAPVLERRDRLLGDDRPVRAVEEADPGAVGLAAALLRQRVRRLQQPERGAQPAPSRRSCRTGDTSIGTLARNPRRRDRLGRRRVRHGRRSVFCHQPTSRQAPNLNAMFR